MAAVGGSLALAGAIIAAAPEAGGGARIAGDAAALTHPALANSCRTLATAGHAIVATEAGYQAVANPMAATAFHLKPTGPRTYLLHDPGRRLLAVAADGAVVRESAATGAAEWRLRRERRGFVVAASASGRELAVAAEDALATADPGAGGRFRLVAARRCARYPEATVGATGRPVAGPNRDGTLFGYADAHLHVNANLRAGGRVIHGQPYHRLGLPEALGHDEDDHGPDGSLDVTGNLLRDASPAGTHDTHGWPTFAGWPVHDTYTHQQVYYRWLERAWRGGLRFVVAQAVEDEALCELQPLKSHSCDETETVRLAIAQLRALERYIDAQHGGRGRGWFRIVTGPRQARRVIEAGQLAVVIGMETSSPLGCSEYQGAPQCTREDIDRVLGELHRLGVRSIFIAHWIDNAFGGAALQRGAQGQFISVFETMTTGHPFATEPCGTADEADGTCNANGLTDLGRYLIRRMMQRGMLIEADHLSQETRTAVFEIVSRRGYPLVSSHTGTGGEWTPEQLRRLYAVGGLAAATPETAPELVTKIMRLRRGAARRGAAVALGSDTGGFAALPGPRDGGPSLRYPFRSYDRRVVFRRQRTGERTYDLNQDGVAHYGLFPDLLAGMRHEPRGLRALKALFGSAEAYVRMWETARRR